MVECIALRDGLIGTGYIHAGETFTAEKCPSWAKKVKAAKAPEAPARGEGDK